MPQPAATVRSADGRREHDDRGLPPCASAGLPPWESFPARDRQLLVRLMIQTARRQIQPHLSHPHLAVERR